LKLDSTSERIEFRAGKFKSKLSGIDSEQFPEIVETNAESIRLPAATIYQGLRRTIFAASEDSQRFTLNGVLLLIEDSVLKMVSTDGNRLSYFRTAVESKTTLRCLIPIKAARELRQILAFELKNDSKAETSIKKGSQLEFAVGNKRMTALELSGNFPNWEMVMPKEFAYFAEINAAKLREAVMRVSVMASVLTAPKAY
jgi:DNA polymerase III subunit beta